MFNYKLKIYNKIYFFLPVLAYHYTRSIIMLLSIIIILVERGSPIYIYLQTIRAYNAPPPYLRISGNINAPRASPPGGGPSSHAPCSLWCTACPRSLDPFHIIIYYIKWVKTSWTYSIHGRNTRYMPSIHFYLWFSGYFIIFFIT